MLWTVQCLPHRRHYINGIDDEANSNKYRNDAGKDGDDVVVITAGCWAKENPETALWSYERQGIVCI